MQTPAIEKEKVKLFPSRSLLANLTFIIISAGLIAWSTSLIKTRMTSVLSRDAVINGVLIDLKTPSQGIVSELSLKTGDMITEGKVITTLKNERVSQLEVQEIATKLNEQKSQLERAKAKLNKFFGLLEIAKKDEENQSRFSQQQAQQSVDEVDSNLKAAEARSRLAQLNFQRTNFLAKEGALSKAALDKASLERQQEAAIVASIKARLAASRTNKIATQNDLALNRTRSNYDPNIRVQELQLEITDQTQEVKSIQQTIENIQKELIQAQADVKRQMTVIVKAPTNGVIWRLAAQGGKYVERGESIGQVLDCQRRWVDVFVDEEAVRELQPGTPANIELYGSSSETLRGKVSLVRSGVGRLAAGEDVAIPISPNLPRNTQVRVELELDTQKQEANRFCYVGYTGRVTFKVRS